MFKIEPPYYPIVYVRGYAMTKGEKEETFNDAYYGFAATSVEKRQGVPENNSYLKADIFEGQLIRLMKNHGYVDSFNNAIAMHANPSRSIWICRFYDDDYLNGKTRDITSHAEELLNLIQTVIPDQLKTADVDLGQNNENFKVILIAHSMGGLVCRTVIQNLLHDPQKFIHRLVTMGTPHKGIELGLVPDSLEGWMADKINAYDSGMFQDKRMRKYLKLEDEKYDLHSLGDTKFPVKRCFCLVGSDYKSYGAAKYLTGSHSDGLVKQSHAYMVTGAKPGEGEDYPDEQVAYSANVHRAHSGSRGIVNSYESYENIQRFLFGNVKVKVSFDELEPVYPEIKDNDKYFYDLEFQLSVRGTNSFLHARKQDPCENAMRFNYGKIPRRILMHTAFLNSKFVSKDDPYLHFLLTFKLVEYHVKEGWLWDKEYPGRTIYSESAEVRAADTDPADPGYELQYRWFSDSAPGEKWEDAQKIDHGAAYTFNLRDAGRLKGKILIETSEWPDNKLTNDF